MSDRPLPFFIGDHLALDFLNTIATPKDVQVEWLRSGQDLVDWLAETEAIGVEVAERFLASKDQQTLDALAGRAREFREWLRAFVIRHAGRPLTPTSVKELGPLNELLAGDTSYPVVEATGGGLRLRLVHRWKSPDELLHPVAEAVADLLCNEDFRLVRACEGRGCTLRFLDRTKPRSRRWCSMAVCGNRTKAAAHRARKTSE